MNFKIDLIVCGNYTVYPTTMEQQPECRIINNRFCVINTENSKVWDPISFHHMFANKLKRGGDEWVECRIASGETLPEDLLEYQGVVITGSHYNTRDDVPWFATLAKFIVDAAARGSPKIYGGCFGCQFVAATLGGEVGKNLIGEFVLKAEDLEVIVDPTVLAERLCCCGINGDNVNPFQNQSIINIVVSHGDSVLTLPNGSERLAQSQSCENEVFVCGAHKNILCVQGHPEFGCDGLVPYCIDERIWPAVVEKSKRLCEESAILARKSLDAMTDADSEKFLQMVSTFLHTPTVVTKDITP